MDKSLAGSLRIFKDLLIHVLPKDIKHISRIPYIIIGCNDKDLIPIFARSVKALQDLW